MNLGILILSISLLAYLSNWLNWRYLSNPLIAFLFYIGTFIHEFSHLIFCRLLGAEIIGGKIFSKKPHIIHGKSIVPIIGQALISLAPIMGGLGFLFLMNKYVLASYFLLPEIGNLQNFLLAPFNLLSQINLLDWQSWLTIILFLNIGAMLGPSFKDLKNMWLVLIVSFFIKWPWLLKLASLAIVFILLNILIQIIVILFKVATSKLKIVVK